MNLTFFLFISLSFLLFSQGKNLIYDFENDFPNHLSTELDNMLNYYRKMTLISNQTNISPKLTLTNSYQIYYCKTTRQTGIRFDFLVREGLLLHPMINLVTSPDQATIVIMIPGSTNWKESECNKPEIIPKIIVLDENDGQEINGDTNFLMTFKRSYVKRKDGKFLGYMHYLSNPKVFPMTYTIGNSYIRPQFFPHEKRVLEILCTLRPYDNDPTRKRVYNFVKEYIESRTNNKHQLVNIRKYQLGQLSGASRPVISHEYFDSMQTTKILVTSNPSHWEGDFRFCESLAGGSLVFVDQMYVPRLKPFINMKHIIVYDSFNKTDLFNKLDWAFSNKKEAELMALKGYFHALKYHRAQNLIDYVMNTFEASINPRNDSINSSGFLLKKIAVAQQKIFKDSLASNNH